MRGSSANSAPLVPRRSRKSRFRWNAGSQRAKIDLVPTSDHGSRDPRNAQHIRSFRSALARAVAALLLLGSTAAALSAHSRCQASAIDGEWRAYGRDALGSRWSPLAEITRENVARLEPAWTYHTGETAPEFAGTTPTAFARGHAARRRRPNVRQHATRPSHGARPGDRARAVEVRSQGRSQHRRSATSRVAASRTGWTVACGSTRAPRACARRVIIATIDGRLIALDAERGTPCASFGTGGTVNLRATLRNKPYETAEYEVTSPPAIINDIIVVGSRRRRQQPHRRRERRGARLRRAHRARSDGRGIRFRRTRRTPRGAPGSVRARTPTGAANAWSVIAADPARDLVFVPTGSASPDYFGGERLGDNRYANSIVALRASTGRVVWHFQVVHHDLWDYDVASPPALVTLRKDGREIPVVLQATKTGQLFVLQSRHRRAGVSGRGAAGARRATCTGERASPTQPFNTVLPPLSPQRLTPDDAFGARRRRSRGVPARIAGLRNEGPFTPPSERGTLVYPSSIGGAHWGGVTYDPVAPDRRRAGESHPDRGEAHSARVVRPNARRPMPPRRAGPGPSTRTCGARRTSCVASSCSVPAARRVRRRRSDRSSRSTSTPARRNGTSHSAR